MVLTNQFWFGLVIGAISVVIFAIGVALTVLLSTLISPLDKKRSDLVHNLGAVAIALHLVNDIVISASLVWYLHHNRTGIQRSDTLIDDIVRCKFSPLGYPSRRILILLPTSNDTDGLFNCYCCHRSLGFEFCLHGDYLLPPDDNACSDYMFFPSSGQVYQFDVRATQTERAS